MPNYKKFAIAQLLLNAVMALAGITFGRAHVLVASVFAGAAIGLFAMSLITIGQFTGNAVEHRDCGREQKASFVMDMSFVAVYQLVVALAIAYDLAVHIGIAPFTVAYGVAMFCVSAAFLKAQMLMAKDFESVAIFAA